MKTNKNSNRNPRLQNRTERGVGESAKTQATAGEQLLETTSRNLFVTTINFDNRRRNRALPMERVLFLMRTKAPRLWELAEVVGKWVWVQFSEKQPREITSVLSEFGFTWNRSRQVWQHPGGTLPERRRRNPRDKYGSYFPADVTPS
jgi:hypothetical protein